MINRFLFFVVLFSIAIASCKNTPTATTTQDSIPAVNSESTGNVVTTGDIPVEPALEQKPAEVVTSSVEKPKIYETNGKIDWYEIQSALNYSNPEGKMFFIDVYTDWCGWCKVMDKKTFSDPRVQKAMNEKFHMVKFNAEQKGDITFNGQKFNWMNAGRNGINTLAVQLLGEQMGFPSYVYLDKNKKPITKTAGYQEVDQFLKTLSEIK
jgi:thioredoxin-related protein